MSFNPPPLPPIQPPWSQFQVWWQQVVESLKSELGGLETAEAALAAAVAAQATADSVNTNASIGLGWTSPGAVLSAADAGSSATITIANHVRHYGDSTTLPVTGASLTGRAYSTTYFVYYDDPTRANTTPTYHTTTDPNVAAPNAATGRHSLGGVTAPPAGGGSTSGGTLPPGGDYSGPAEIP